VIGYDAAMDRAAGFYVTEQGVTLVSPEMLGQDINQIR
jgi:glucose-1-phosphate adenylyltransferase